jgi:hypothetical protein
MRQKDDMWWLVLPLVLLAACPAPRRYAVEQPGLSCEQATRLAYDTMQQLGYTVTEAVPATLAAPGRVAGTKRRPDGSLDQGVVRIACGASGATLQPVEGDLVPRYEFSRGFGYSSTALAKQPAPPAAARAGDLEVSVEAIDVPRATLDLGSWPLAAAQVLVRVTVRNGTDRAVVIEGERVLLLAADGSMVAPLAGQGLATSWGTAPSAAAVRTRLLAREKVAPRATVERYLVYPPGRYDEAQVALEDVETGEADGFQVPVR